MGAGTNPDGVEAPAGVPTSAAVARLPKGPGLPLRFGGTSAIKSVHMMTDEEPVQICKPMEMWYWNDEKTFVKETLYVNPKDQQQFPRLIIPLTMFETINESYSDTVCILDEKTMLLEEALARLSKIRVGYFKEIEHLRKLLDLAQTTILRQQNTHLSLKQIEKREMEEKIVLETDVHFYDAIEGLCADMKHICKKQTKAYNKHLILENHDLKQKLRMYEDPSDPNIVQKMVNMILENGTGPDEINRAVDKAVKEPDKREKFNAAMMDSLKLTTDNRKGALDFGQHGTCPEPFASEIKELKYELEEAHRQIEVLEKSGGADVDALRAELEQKDQEISNLMQQNATLEEELMAKAGWVPPGGDDAELEGLRAEIAALNVHLEELRQAISNKDDQIKRLEGEGGDTAALREAHRKELERLQAQLDEEKQKLEIAKAKLEEQKNEMESMKVQMTRLASELSEANSGKSDGNGILSDEDQAKIEIYDALLREFGDEFSAVWIRSLLDTNAESVAELESLREQMSEYGEQYKEMDEYIKQTQTILQKIHSMFTSVEKQITTFHPVSLESDMPLPNKEELELLQQATAQFEEIVESDGRVEADVFLQRYNQLENAARSFEQLTQFLIRIHKDLIIAAEKKYDQQAGAMVDEELHSFLNFLLRRFGNMRDGFIQMKNGQEILQVTDLEEYLKAGDYMQFLSQRLIERFNNYGGKDMNIDELLKTKNQWVKDVSSKTAISRSELDLERRKFRDDLADAQIKYSNLLKEFESLKGGGKGGNDKGNKQQITFLKRKIDILQNELKRTKVEYEDMEVKATTAMWRLRMNRIDFDRLTRENDKIRHDQEKVKIKLEKARHIHSTKRILATLNLLDQEGLRSIRSRGNGEDSSPERDRSPSKDIIISPTGEKRNFRLSLAGLQSESIMLSENEESSSGDSRLAAQRLRERKTNQRWNPKDKRDDVDSMKRPRSEPPPQKKEKKSKERPYPDHFEEKEALKSKLLEEPDYEDLVLRRYNGENAYNMLQQENEDGVAMPRAQTADQPRRRLIEGDNRRLNDTVHVRGVTFSPCNRDSQSKCFSQTHSQHEEDDVFHGMDPYNVPYRIRIEAAFAKTKRWQLLYADFLHRLRRGRRSEQNISPRRSSPSRQPNLLTNTSAPVVGPAGSPKPTGSPKHERPPPELLKAMSLENGQTWSYTFEVGHRNNGRASSASALHSNNGMRGSALTRTRGGQYGGMSRPVSQPCGQDKLISMKISGINPTSPRLDQEYTSRSEHSLDRVNHFLQNPPGGFYPPNREYKDLPRGRSLSPKRRPKGPEQDPKWGSHKEFEDNGRGRDSNFRPGTPSGSRSPSSGRGGSPGLKGSMQRQRDSPTRTRSPDRPQAVSPTTHLRDLPPHRGNLGTQQVSSLSINGQEVSMDSLGAMMSRSMESGEYILHDKTGDAIMKKRILATPASPNSVNTRSASPVSRPTSPNGHKIVEQSTIKIEGTPLFTKKEKDDATAPATIRKEHPYIITQGSLAATVPINPKEAGTSKDGRSLVVTECKLFDQDNTAQVQSSNFPQGSPKKASQQESKSPTHKNGIKGNGLIKGKSSYLPKGLDKSTNEKPLHTSSVVEQFRHLFAKGPDITRNRGVIHRGRSHAALRGGSRPNTRGSDLEPSPLEAPEVGLTPDHSTPAFAQTHSVFTPFPYNPLPTKSTSGNAAGWPTPEPKRLKPLPQQRKVIANVPDLRPSSSGQHFVTTSLESRLKQIENKGLQKNDSKYSLGIESSLEIQSAIFSPNKSQASDKKLQGEPSMESIPLS